MRDGHTWMLKFFLNTDIFVKILSEYMTIFTLFLQKEKVLFSCNKRPSLASILIALL